MYSLQSHIGELWDNAFIVQTLATRFPLLFTFGFFLLAGIVYAQVLPEEGVQLQEQSLQPVEEVSSSEEAATSSDTTVPSDNATTTASSTDLLDEAVATTTTIIEEEPTQVVRVADTPMTPLMEENFAPVARTDFLFPRHCQSLDVEDFFEDSRECVRYVINTNARERYEAAGIPIPDRLEEE